MMLGTHAVKVKFPDRGVWDFITPDGGTTRLRIHAATMTPERADEAVARILASPDHKDIQAKAVKL